MTAKERIEATLATAEPAPIVHRSRLIIHSLAGAIRNLEESLRWMHLSDYERAQLTRAADMIDKAQAVLAVLAQVRPMGVEQAESEHPLIRLGSGEYAKDYDGEPV